MKIHVIISIWVCRKLMPLRKQCWRAPYTPFIQKYQCKTPLLWDGMIKQFIGYNTTFFLCLFITFTRSSFDSWLLRTSSADSIYRMPVYQLIKLSSSQLSQKSERIPKNCSSSPVRSIIALFSDKALQI